MKRIWMLTLLITGSVQAQERSSFLEKETARQQSVYENWYQRLHAQPELSTREEKTAAFLKQELAAMGYEMVGEMGYHSFAAILRNGKGPVILYRTDMDGLPVKEQTGLPFASTVQYDKEGEKVSAMHACGHDIHMSTWLGIAQMMQAQRKNWSGTFILLAQSAEETGQGAKKVVASAAFQNLPRADIQLAIHDHAELPAGQAGFCDGYSMAAVDMMNITIYGKGGHGAVPQQAIDPVLLASKYVVSIQEIVSRNLGVNDPAVITVGAIHGGTVGNIIPDQVQLKLTIRSFSAASRQLILDRLKTIGDGLAAAAGLGADRYPKYELLDMTIPSVYNDPALGVRIRGMMQKQFGDSSVAMVKPIMIGEDFGVYGQQAGAIPSYIIWMGTVGMGRQKGDTPSLHSAKFAPDYRETIPKAVGRMSGVLMGLFGTNFR